MCEVVEVEDQRRWVWNVIGLDGVGATWGFEVEPASDGALVRQWGRMGPGTVRSQRPAIAAQPDKEARIVARRLSEWQQNMQANLEWIRVQVERLTSLGYCSGFISCSIVGTSSLTVGWMCIVREIAV